MTSFAGSSSYIEALLPILNSVLSVKILASGVGADILTRDGFQVDYRIENDSIELEKVLDDVKPDLIFLVPQFGNSIEELTILKAKKRNIPCIAGIDHWGFYKERFSITNLSHVIVGDGFQLLPDLIIVNDRIALNDAITEGIPSDLLVIGGNPLLEKRWHGFNFINNYENKDNNHSILFISEPYSNNFPKGGKYYRGFTELDVLQDILEAMPPSSDLYIKKHPSEFPEKFLKYIESKDNCNFSDDNSILLKADMIVGMGSMLLLEISLIRELIISYRPNEAIEFIGNKLGYTTKIKDKVQLERALKGSSHFRNSSLEINYKGSRKKIVDTIMSFA